jgi:hypothetical protein
MLNTVDFAAAGGPDDTHHLACADVEGDVLQHGNVGVVCERHVLEGDLVSERCRLPWRWTLGDHYVGIADRRHSLKADRHLGDRVGHLREVAHGGEKRAR